MYIKTIQESNKTKKQVAGGFLSPEWLINPNLAEPYVKQAADAGYYAYVFFVRQMNQTIMNSKVHDAIAKIVEIVHRHGMKFILDTDPTWWSQQMIELKPEASLWCIIPVEAYTADGAFKVNVKWPATPTLQVTFKEVSALYTKDNNGEWQLLENMELLECDWQGVSAPVVRGVTLKGRIKGGYSGSILLYVSLASSSLLDNAHPAYLQQQKKLLDEYNDIPIDGVAWDEPGKGHRALTSFRAGAGFLDLFEQNNGYDLRDKLIYLDHYDGTPDAVKTRCDYFRTLSDMNYNAQLEHNNYARGLWGDDIICGTHQTWSGLPSDLAAGVFDHFRLGKLLTGVWTDGGIEFERKIQLFPLMLADSIKKENEERDAYYNDWSSSGCIETTRFFNRLKTLFHINTFTHVYSDNSEHLANMRFEPLRRSYEADIKLQDHLDAMIGEKLGDTDVAVWYGWQGYAALPKWGARAVYTCLLNLTLVTTDSGLYADFVSNEGLSSSQVKGDKLHIGENSYKVLIIPYAHAIPEAVYNKLIEAAEKGVKVVFVGPQPEFTETGKPLDFCNLIGVSPVTHKCFEATIKQKGIAIPVDACEPSFLDVICPVQPTSATAFRNIEEEIFALKAEKSELYWMPSLDPREELRDLIAPLCKSNIEVFSPNAYFRTFTNKSDPNDFVLVLAPREGIPGWGVLPTSFEDFGESDPTKRRPLEKPVKLNVLAIIKDKQLRVSGGAWCALHFRNHELVECLADDEMSIQFS